MDVVHRRHEADHDSVDQGDDEMMPRITEKGGRQLRTDRLIKDVRGNAVQTAGI